MCAILFFTHTKNFKDIFFIKKYIILNLYYYTLHIEYIRIRALGIVEPEVGLLSPNKGVSFGVAERAFAEEALWKTKALPVHKSITFHRGGLPVSLSFAPLTLSYITRLPVQFGCTSCMSRMRCKAPIIRILCAGNCMFYEFQMCSWYGRIWFCGFMMWSLVLRSASFRLNINFGVNKFWNLTWFDIRKLLNYYNF